MLNLSNQHHYNKSNNIVRARVTYFLHLVNFFVYNLFNVALLTESICEVFSKLATDNKDSIHDDISTRSTTGTTLSNGTSSSRDSTPPDSPASPILSPRDISANNDIEEDLFPNSVEVDEVLQRQIALLILKEEKTREAYLGLLADVLLLLLF